MKYSLCFKLGFVSCNIFSYVNQIWKIQEQKTKQNNGNSNKCRVLTSETFNILIGRLSHPNFWVINNWSARCEYFENSKNKFLNTLLKGALGEFQVKAIFVENCRDFKDSNATNHFKIGWNCHNHSNKLSENPKSEN